MYKYLCIKHKQFVVQCKRDTYISTMSSKAIIYKSRSELSLLLEYTTDTFGSTQSCDFNKLKVYETNIFMFKTSFLPVLSI